MVGGMKGILFVSTALVPFSRMSLLHLKEKAEAHNQANAITGYLYFESNQTVGSFHENGDQGNGRFLEYLEGEPHAVDELVERISAEPRHEILTTFEEKITRRRFSSWDVYWLRHSTFAGMEQLLLRYLLFSKSGMHENETIIRLLNALATHRERLNFLSETDYFLKR